MVAHSKSRLQQSKKRVKERKWTRIPLAMFGNRNSKQISALHIGSLLNIDLPKIMWICAIFMDMYLTSILGSIYLWVDLSRGLESLERWHGCVQLQGNMLGTTK